MSWCEIWLHTDVNILAEGIEPSTLGLLDPRSNQLSYASWFSIETSGRVLARAATCNVTILILQGTNSTLKQICSIPQISRCGHNQVSFLAILDEQELFNIDHYKGAIMEATLTHMPMEEKKNILSNLQKHVDQILLHNVCLLQDHEILNEEIVNEVNASLGKTCGFYPLTIQNWKELVEDCGYKNNANGD